MYHLLSGIYLLVWLDFCFKYLLSFILLVFLFLRSDSISDILFLFNIHFMIKNPLYTDPQLIWKYKAFFVTLTIAVNSPEPTIYSVIFSYVYLSSLFNKDAPSFDFFVFVVVFFVVFVAAFIVVGNCH